MSGGAMKRCKKHSRRRCRSTSNKRKYYGKYPSGTYKKCPKGFNQTCKKNHEYIMFLSKFVNSRANKEKYPDFKTRRSAGIAAWNNRKESKPSPSSSSSSGPSFTFAKISEYLFGTSAKPDCYDDMCKEGIKTKSDFKQFVLKNPPDKLGKDMTKAQLDLYNNIITCYRKGKYCSE